MKMDGVDPPKHANPGLMGEGAVQLLYLTDTQHKSQGGIDTVYRLETAGGKAPATCKGQDTYFAVQYAAQCECTLPDSHSIEQRTNDDGRLDFWPALRLTCAAFPRTL
jgi:hypothetical protein